MNQTTDATAIFAPIWKRKWLILIVGLLVAAASYYYYDRKPKLYSSTTQLYLGNGAEEQQQIGSSGGGSGKKGASANPATQALLINSSIIKDAVKARLRKEHKSSAVRAALKGKTKTKATTKSEFITIDGEAHNSRGAALLVNLTAQEYIKRANAHHHKEVATALALARRQVRKIEAGEAARTSSKSKSGGKSTSSTTATLQAATLSNKINQLEADLSVKEVAQVDPATRKGSKLLSPHPKTNAIFGFALGLLLAALAAYIRSRLDRRLRSLSAVESVYEAQILTALPSVKRPLVRGDGPPAPAKPLLEALWRLQTTLQVGYASPPNGASGNGHGHAPRVILCVSADAGDGKSTLFAALALAMADTGERVALVEADFRRPVQSRMLGVDGQAGLADVLTGRLTLEEAVQTVSLAHAPAGVGPGQPSTGAVTTMVDSSGSVSLLAGSTTVANPPSLLGRSSMTDLLQTLAGDFQYVLVDAPSPLQVSDVMPLLGLVDGIVIVARIGHTRENSAARLVQLLKQTPSAPVLGVVANAVSQADVEKYGLAGQRTRRWRPKLIGR
jgi:Mrp family chromosome partitioning ATPase/capsular polysaccharide biosynthesis protein